MDNLADHSSRENWRADSGASGQPFGDLVASRRTHHEGVAAAVQFLKDFDPDGWHNLVRLDPTKRRAHPIGRTIPPGRWDLVEEFVAEFAGRENIYFSPNEPAPDSPDAKLANRDIARIRAIYADVDLPAGNDAAAVAELHREIEAKFVGLPEPTHIIDTGGGVQMHWRLAEKLPSAEWAQWAADQARGIADHFDGDRVIDVSRIMRLPGVPNIPTPEKTAKGRRERMASVIRLSGGAHAPDDLMRAVPPIPRAVGKQLEQDAAIAAVQEQLVATWPELSSAATLDDLPFGLRERFAAACGANDRLRLLWAGDPPQSGDASGSGYRAALASALGRSGKFGPEDFAALTLVWDWPVQAGDYRDFKLTPRTLARDWVNCGAPHTTQAIVDRYYDPEAAAKAVPITAGEPSSSLFPAAPPDLFDVLSVADIFERPDAKFIIGRHVPEGGLGFLYGDPGAGKSFIALDWALHLAFGLPNWHGDPIDETHRGSVIYLAGEGASGFKSRIRAWMAAHDVRNDREGRFGLIAQGVNLMQREQVQKLAATLRARFAGKVALVVIDTVSRSMPGVDENLQKDMTLFVDACATFQAEFGATVLGVHHANQAGQMRGSSVLLGAGDFVFKFDRKKGAPIGKLVCEKMKDAPDGWGENYRLEVTPGGDGSTSLVPLRCGGADGKAGLSPELTKRVLDAIEAAWDAKEPWARYPQSKERYAVTKLSAEFGFGKPEAEELISVLIGTGRIEEGLACSSAKKRGYRVIRDTADAAEPTGEVFE